MATNFELFRDYQVAKLHSTKDPNKIFCILCD